MTAPFAPVIRAQVDSAGLTADPQTVVGAVPFDGVVSSVLYVPVAAVTGANTNSRTLTVTNRKQDGSGVVNVATLALVSGVNIPADDEKALTLSATPANLVVAAGDVLSLESTHVGTGIAEPGGSVTIAISRTYA